MFTGLVKDIGTIEKITPNTSGKELVIRAPKLCKEIQIDDSVATSGVCLTATKIEGECFTVQAVHVTLEKTALSQIKIGSKVNLELALLPTTRLGGHFVQGHVNGVGSIGRIVSKGNNYDIWIKAPRELFKYMIKEGSIAVDGISLTIADLNDHSFCISIIPHTYENTVLQYKKIGDLVNIEVDMMAKYLENFLKFEDKKINWQEALRD